MLITLLLYLLESLYAQVLYIYFQFWDGVQHSIPKVWEIVLSNIPFQSRIVHSYVHGFFDCSGHIVSLPAYDFEVFHRCCIASVVLVLKNWWWCLQIFFIPFLKRCRWFSYVFILTGNPVTPKPINHTALLCDSIFVFWWHQEVLKRCSSFKVYLYSIFLADVLAAFTGALCIWNYNIAFFLGGWRNMPILLYYFSDVVFGWLVYGPPGILALPDEFSRCFNSLFNNSGVEHI